LWANPNASTDIAWVLNPEFMESGERVKEGERKIFNHGVYRSTRDLHAEKQGN
jgi:hypothetical protein